MDTVRWSSAADDAILMFGYGGAWAVAGRSSGLCQVRSDGSRSVADWISFGISAW